MIIKLKSNINKEKILKGHFQVDIVHKNRLKGNNITDIIDLIIDLYTQRQIERPLFQDKILLRFLVLSYIKSKKNLYL